MKVIVDQRIEKYGKYGLYNNNNKLLMCKCWGKKVDYGWEDSIRSHFTTRAVKSTYVPAHRMYWHRAMMTMYNKRTNVKQTSRSATGNDLLVSATVNPCKCDGCKPISNPPSPPFRGGKSTDLGSMFQAEVNWHKSGQVGGVCCAWAQKHLSFGCAVVFTGIIDVQSVPPPLPASQLTRVLLEIGGIQHLLWGAGAGVATALWTILVPLPLCLLTGANILVSDKGEVKLTDFGCAATKPQGFGALGTVLWMAPEVCREEHYQASCDIWSLGCTVLQMVTNELPWAERC